MATLTPPAQADPAASSPPAPAGTIAVPVLAIQTCPSCGAAVAGDWCSACGERLLRDEHFSARNFFREFRDEVLDLDGRALRSVRLLLTKPGFLTLEALQGRRRLYLGAFRMYLAVFALLTLASALLAAKVAQREQKADALARRLAQLVHELAQRRQISDLSAQRLLLDTTLQHESWISFGIPLLFAVLLFALLGRRRRWFGEHLLFATHWATFYYLLTLLLIPLDFAGTLLGGAAPSKVGVVTLYLLSTCAQVAYMAIAFRRVYGGGRAGSLAWGIALMMCFSVATLIVAVIALATAAARLAYF